MQSNTVFGLFVVCFLAWTCTAATEIGAKIYFASQEVMEFKDVASFCVRPEFNDRFRIAEINSPQQNAAAVQALKLANEVTGEKLEGWLSGYRINKQWFWPNRDKIGFKKVEQTKPSDKAVNNSCLLLPLNGKWKGTPCSEKHRAICQGFAYTKVYDFVARNKQLDRSESEAECGASGGTLASILSEEEQDVVRIRVSTSPESTRSPTKRPTTRSPTAKPTRKKKKCCPTECCFKGFENPCPGCECCCCNPEWKRDKYRRCCKKNGPRFCGCRSVKLTKRPTFGPIGFRRLTSRQVSVEEVDSDDDEFPTVEEIESEETNENEESTIEDLTESEIWESSISTSAEVSPIDEFFVFLSAKNEKVEYVKEENGSFIWSNGISFKPVGYLPAEVSEQFTNWDTYPLQNPNHTCAVMSSVDGKWRSAPCDVKGRGALCEFRSAKKRYQIYPTTIVNMTAAGMFCAETRGQLASIKSLGELKAAKKEFKRVNKLCKGCLDSVWLNGKRFGTRYYWSDGQIFFRNELPIGLDNEFEPETFGNGDCVALTEDWRYAGSNCSALLFPMCEYRVPGDAKWTPPPVDVKACFPGCLQTFIGDGVCDPVCNHYTCNFDGDDCGQCAPGCSADKLNNGECDPECFNATCAYDSRDCFPDGEAELPSIVGRLLTEEESSDETAAVPELGSIETVRDLAKARRKLPKVCSQTSKKCKPKWIGDKYCDLIACGRECDAADCQQVVSPTECAKTCSTSDLYNDRCDKGCATLACNFDGGLCPVSCDAACGNRITLNQCSKPQCDVPMCAYDIGRCRDNSNIAQRCSPQCELSMLGNGQCDPECDNQACNWDAGDCPESDFCPYPLPFNEYGCIDQCNKPLFKFQRGACVNTCLSTGCRPEMLGNGVCDNACNNARCGMDGGDCAPCAPGCNPFMLNDGVCDPNCNLSGKCENDGGDCN